MRHFYYDGYDNGTSRNLLLTGGGDGVNPGTITLNSLVAGNTYQVKIWAPTWNHYLPISVGGVTLHKGYLTPTGNVPQYIVGAFTAIGDTQTISWSGIAPSAVSLRDLTPASGYAGWATTNGVTGGVNGDSNNNGVQNGIAYFMKDSGRITNPGLNAGNTVIWTNGGNIPSTEYGTRFVVQTSTDLSRSGMMFLRPIPCTSATPPARFPTLCPRARAKYSSASSSHLTESP